MNRFNLTFRGEIIEGHDPEQVKIRLARMLAIDDPATLRRLFSGDPVVLRRDMGRKEAAGLYARLRQQGIQAELVKIGERGDLRSGAVRHQTPTAAPTRSSREAAPPATSPEAATSARKVIRRADLAADKNLRADDSLQLAAREMALQKALRAKQADAAKQDKANAIAREKADAIAREKARARETKLSAKQEAARKKTELAETKRQAEQEAARRRDEQQRQREEAAAKRRAELEQEQAQEAARKAERERLEAEARERLAAEREQRKAQERQRLAAERAQREQREAEERQRLAAEQAQREQARREEQQRLAAERAQQEQREAEERQRLAVEQAQREQARREEQQRLAAEKALLREEEKRKAEQLAARLQVEQARRKREQAAEAARRKAEEVRKRAQEQARLKAEEEERLAQRRAMEEQAIQRAAAELAQKPALKPVDARVKTRLDTPSRRRRSEAPPAEGRRQRQPGAPNFYSLRPFRNTPEIRDRSNQSQRIMWQAFAGAALAISIALALGLLGPPPPLAVNGAGAGAVGPQDRPLLLAGDHLLLHDRAGQGVGDLALDRLGLATASAPLAFDTAGELLLTGRLKDAAADGQPSQLLRCVVAESRCKPFPASLADTQISALAVNPVDGSLFIADSRAGKLLKLSPEGAVLAQAEATIPAAPVLRLDAGLLLLNSAEGASISVFRYEDEAFGRQLDEILLLPKAGSAAEFTGVRDFLRSGEYWWVLLDQAGSDRPGLYRFDAQWQFLDRPPLAADTRPAALLDWGGRVLVLDPSRVPVQRFSAEGMVEAPLVSSVLTALVAGRERRADLIQLGRQVGITLCVLGAIAGLLIGSLHRVRSLVYNSCRERGAEPIDKMADSIDWLELAPDRSACLGRIGVGYALLATCLLLGAVYLGVSSLQLTALLLALAGPVVALILLQRSDPGHIGIHDNALLLVDHAGMYHLGSDGRVHCRGPFLMIDDVIVFSGVPQLPAFAPAEFARRVLPLAAHGVRVDRKIVTVKLLQGRHPLALGALAIIATLAAALTLLSLQGIF